MDPINICFSCDSLYIQHLATAIISILCNAKDKEQIVFHLIYSNIVNDLLSYLHELVSSYGADILFYKSDFDYSKCPLGYHFTEANYYRLNLPQTLHTLKYCVYLDCDIIVNDDIGNLFNVGIGDHLIAAVEDLCGNANNYRLGIPDDRLYFNSGVLLMNLDLWRKYNISQILFDFIINNTNSILLVDQDALNHVLYDKWFQLHPRWNVQTAMFTEARNKYSDIVCLKQAIDDPGIIHYSTSSKPWHYLNNHPMKELYYKYLKMTKWSNYVPPDKKVFNIIRRYYYRLIGKQYI